MGLPKPSPRAALAVALLATAALGVVFVVTPELRSWLGWLLAAGPVGLVISHFPNETKQVVARVLGWFSRYSTRAELESARQDLEGTISLGVARLKDGCPDSSIAGFRLEYIRSEAAVERLADGTLVIGVAEHHDRVRNLVTATYALVRNGVIPRSRPYLDGEVSQAIDFVLTKAILSDVDRVAVSEFLTTVWTPAVLGRDRLRELTDRVSRLQQSALLGPIVLSEFHDLATQVGERFPNDDIAEETARFVDYLHTLSLHKPGEILGDSTNFEGQIIRCRVVFVPTGEAYKMKGPRAYREAIEWSMDNTFHHLYLLASGQNASQLLEVVEPYRGDARVRRVDAFEGMRPNLSGRLMPQLVVRLEFDIRYFVGIGQRPLVAVGPGRPRHAIRSGVEDGGQRPIKTA